MVGSLWGLNSLAKSPAGLKNPSATETDRSSAHGKSLIFLKLLVALQLPFIPRVLSPSSIEQHQFGIATPASAIECCEGFQHATQKACRTAFIRPGLPCN